MNSVVTLADRRTRRVRAGAPVPDSGYQAPVVFLGQVNTPEPKDETVSTWEQMEEAASTTGAGPVLLITLCVLLPMAVWAVVSLFRG